MRSLVRIQSPRLVTDPGTKPRLSARRPRGSRDILPFPTKRGEGASNLGSVRRTGEGCSLPNPNPGSERRARLLPPFPNELGSRGRRRMTAERQPRWGRRKCTNGLGEQDPNRRCKTSATCDDKRVEDFVEAKCIWPGIGFFACVDDRAYGVEYAAADHEGDRF